ncbi:MAG: SDR family oxidoreductase [Candidatus Dadabacteria bacterium]|nr:MAG: SDR family oxidoreductase [Candidatus Dadabacteria bacterium]
MVRIFKSVKNAPERWLVSGVAGFIGSNILEALLENKQKVIGIDNFATGHRSNLEDVKNKVGDKAWANFDFIEGDICNQEICLEASKDVDVILHQAALGSVPRSIEDPLASNKANVEGTLNIFFAARQNKVSRVVYASSSSVYGDSEVLPKVENQTGLPLSPYAVTKAANELYGRVFADLYGMTLIGLRYFNVFGPRQDPEGPYAAVIPRWINLLLSGKECEIYGDGKTSRDFCFVENAVQANVLAALKNDLNQGHYVFNVACSKQTTLLELYAIIREAVSRYRTDIKGAEPLFCDFRRGDIRHSLASIDLISQILSYQPLSDLNSAIQKTVDWFAAKHQ